MTLQPLDLAVVAIYAIVLLVLAQWVSREKAGHEKNSSDYFLAGRNSALVGDWCLADCGQYFRRANHRHVRIRIRPGYRNWRL